MKSKQYIQPRVELVQLFQNEKIMQSGTVTSGDGLQDDMKNPFGGGGAPARKLYL